jgi:hypothetical protein
LTAKANLLDERGKEYPLPPFDLKEMMFHAGDAKAIVSFVLEFPEAPPGRYMLRINTTETRSQQTATIQTDIELN